MSKLKKHVFQVDSVTVQKVFAENNNYRIEYSKEDAGCEKYCALYFSSNDIYYPNEEAVFNHHIVGVDRYEWFKTRINYASKHIYLRDIKKQWYLSGINARLDSIETLLEFLKKETDGYKTVALGSSAGGYAAVLLGQLLGSERIFTFNGQFQLNDLLRDTDESTNPVIFREQDNPAINKYFSLRQHIRAPEKTYYFFSKNSPIDKTQYEHIKDLGIKTVFLKTSHHGIPVLKCNLPEILARKESYLQSLVNNVYHPIWFSFRLVGIQQTISGLSNQIYSMLKKRYGKH